MELGSRQDDFAYLEGLGDLAHTAWDACLKVKVVRLLYLEVERIVTDLIMGIDLVSYVEVDQYVVVQPQDAFPLEANLEHQEHLEVRHFAICQMEPFITIDTSVIKGDHLGLY